MSQSDATPTTNQDESQNSVPAIPEGMDRQMFDLVFAAIAANPLAQLLSQEDQTKLAIDAIELGKASDPEWLVSAIKVLEDNSPTIPGSKIPKIPTFARPEIEDIEDLKEALLQHHDWIASVLGATTKNRGGRLDLSGKSFAGWILEDLDLRGVSFKGCDFREATISGCNFSTCQLHEADFTESNISFSKFRRADLSYCIFQSAQLNACDLRFASLEYSRWQDAKLSEIKHQDKLPRSLALLLNAEVLEDATEESEEEGQLSNAESLPKEENHQSNPESLTPVNRDEGETLKTMVVENDDSVASKTDPVQDDDSTAEPAVESDEDFLENSDLQLEI